MTTINFALIVSGDDKILITGDEVQVKDELYRWVVDRWEPADTFAPNNFMIKEDAICYFFFAREDPSLEYWGEAEHQGGW